MPYPHELESWWLAAACRATGSDDRVAALQRLESAAARLSDQFTVDRPKTFQDYASDPLSLAAYGILFFPQTFARVSLVIGECLTEGALLRGPKKDANAGTMIPKEYVVGNFVGSFVDEVPDKVPDKDAE